MKIAILSDIHGNWHALEPVLHQIHREGVDRLFVLGDQVGYYYDAVRVRDALEALDCEMIAGNHERMLVAYADGSPATRETITSKYGSSFPLLVEEAGPSFVAWAKALPVRKEVVVEGQRMLLCHGTPWDPDAYVYPDTPLTEIARFASEGHDAVFAGHTHHPLVRNEGSCLIVNPGSVGQSRISGGVAQWGILNLANRVYTPRATLYDTAPLKAQIAGHDPHHPYLAHVLDRNR